jgi:diphosphomevalonate decarboxylase
MVVVVVEAPPKEIGSREGMELSRLTSPFYRRWVLADRFHYREMASALRGWSLSRVGELLEENMLAMHACMLTTRPPLIYWSPASLSVIQATRRWRATGLEAYATTDAGAHVALLCRREDLPQVAERARELRDEGAAIVDVIESGAGGPAEIVAGA